MVLKASEKLIASIARFREGEETAFDVIYQESIKYVTRSVLNVINRTAPPDLEDLKQDIIQDTYLTIATKLDSLHNPQFFLQWAGQIATNHALRTWKNNNKIHDNEVDLCDDTEDFVDDLHIPEDILWDSEKRKLIRSMLEELPTNQYLCVVEYFYNGLKEREVAEKLGIPVNTVKTNLSRAKKKLRAIVETEEKKTGVRLYSMSGLLLVLLWNETLTVPAAAAQDAVVLGAVHESLSAGGTAAAGAAAAEGAAAAAGSAGTTVSAGLAAKAAAIAIAAAVALGGASLMHKSPDIPDDAFRFNNHSYYIVNEPCATWEEAKAYCEDMGGYLAVITSEEENTALYQYLREQGIKTAYIGLYLDETDGTWKWVNDEPMEYMNWNPGEPNNERGKERYGMFYYKFTSGTWNDGDFGKGTAGDSSIFLCEWNQ